MDHVSSWLKNWYTLFTELVHLIYRTGTARLPNWYTVVTEIWYTVGYRLHLGASIQNIVALLSIDFLRLVLLSAFIAFPIAWISMHQWLKDFVYRTSIGWSVFLVAGSSAIMIALLTIGFQAIRAAVANPAKSLRTE